MIPVVQMEEEYFRWLGEAGRDEDVIKELKDMEGDACKIQDAFYKNLEFGTGGLRGVIGAGTNRMNVYTVAKATQGYADYLKKNFPIEKRMAAISFDSRIKSELFAKSAAEVLAANGVRVLIFRELMPTPCLSYAVRQLGCAGGIMVTASHNPAQYNGYKVYGADGGQITDTAAAKILSDIDKTDVLNGAKRIAFEEGLGSGTIQFIGDDVIDAYIGSVKSLSLAEQEMGREDMSIVYSPLNGTGRVPVFRCLRECGFRKITMVKEQEYPDGTFPTCPYPNPEEKDAMALGIEYAKRVNADLVLATDPDCDRVGIAVKKHENEYTLLSGNETGILLFDYICSERLAQGKMPEDPVAVKTIVTTEMARAIAQNYGVRLINVLTGFKYIGEQITQLEKSGRGNSYIFGFEESYGYLSGTHVRDKDAVNASLLICEMFAHYKEKGISLIDRLTQLFLKYGYWVNTLHSIRMEGADGMAKMQEIMEKFRAGVDEFAGYKVAECTDYAEGINGLPKSNVLQFRLENQCSVVIRPSGTEPKLKVYISACAGTKELAERAAEDVKKFVIRFC